MQDDVVIVLSQNMIQVALQAYATQNFIDQVFHFSSVGLSFLGKDIQLEVHADKAVLIISVLSRFQVKAWNKALTERRELLFAEAEISFEIHDNQLFVRLEEGNIRIKGAEFIGKIATSAVNNLLQRLFSKPIIKLPIHIDVATPHANSTDESHMILQSISLQPDALRVAFTIKNVLVTHPEVFQDANTQTYQRSRAIKLTASGIEAYHQHMFGRAASFFLKAVIEADLSYELGRLWLSLVVNTPQERKYCLERAFQINQMNTKVVQELNLYKNTSAIIPLSEDYDIFS